MSENAYELLGGEATLRAVVDRFYALMDELPEAWPAPAVATWKSYNFV